MKKLFLRFPLAWSTWAVITAALILAGCQNDPYRAAIQGSSDVSQAVSSAIKITASYYKAGTFNDSQKATAAKYLTVVTDCNTSFRHEVITAHNNGATGAALYLPIADGFLTCVQTAAPIQADQKLGNVLKAVDTAINGISLAVANAKGK